MHTVFSLFVAIFCLSAPTRLEAKGNQAKKKNHSIWIPTKKFTSKGTRSCKPAKERSFELGEVMAMSILTEMLTPGCNVWSISKLAVGTVTLSCNVQGNKYDGALYLLSTDKKNTK